MLHKQGKISPLVYSFYIDMEARLGHRDEVESAIRELFDQTRRDKWEFPNSEATAAAAYAVLGDVDLAFPLLENALAEPSGESLTVGYLRFDPRWDPLRSDPRFQKLCPPR